jgi:drug/metabolite transporter (DMT)-like permease
LAFGGLALMGSGTGAVQPSDLFLVLCALFWAVHILFIDRYADRVSPVRFTAAQFIVCAAVCAVCALVFEDINVQGLSNAIPELLFGGVAVSGVAYTLQIIGQRGVGPSLAAIIFSVQAVFTAAAETLILGETMTPRMYAGGAVILAGIIVSQWRVIRAGLRRSA